MRHPVVEPEDLLGLLAREGARSDQLPPDLATDLWSTIAHTSQSVHAVDAVLSRVDSQGLLKLLALKTAGAKLLPLVIMSVGFVAYQSVVRRSEGKVTLAPPAAPVVEPKLEPTVAKPEAALAREVALPQIKIKNHRTARMSATPSFAASTADTGSPPVAAPDDTLAEEHRLLELARAALEQGRSVPARVALKAHASRFPTGLLCEERDALFVRVLLQEGAIEEARVQTAAFANRYARSVFLAPLLDGLRAPRSNP